MPSYLALLHTNRGYQRFKMIELALTTYSVLFVDNQSLLCKWRFHNCTAYAIFILMIQSVYWIIDQYQSVMQSYFLRNAFPCSLTAFFLLKYFPKFNLCRQALYLWNGLCFGLVLCWHVFIQHSIFGDCQYLVKVHVGPLRCVNIESVSCPPENMVGFDKRLPFQMISNVRDSARSYSCVEPKPDWLLFDDTGTSDAALCAKSKL